MITPEESYVVIDARSNVHPISTRTAGLEGFVELDVEGEDVDLRTPPRARLELRVDRLRSGNPLEDRELRRRIDAKRYPTIRGELTGMTPGPAPHVYVVRGDVTFRGTTREYTDNMEIVVRDRETLQINGAATFDIRDFGMEPPRILMLRVEPEVHVRVELIAAMSANP